ncbi:MAG: hypothetical protein K8T26_06525 [Lentisphaerae bacterium]|nr:hypothetical protein [Lentisphaerota bacterium]
MPLNLTHTHQVQPWRAVLLALLFAATSGAELADFGTAGAVWTTTPPQGKGAPGAAVAAPGKDGAPGVRLTTPQGSSNLGAIQRQAALAPGLYELTVWAQGSGELVTRAGRAQRVQPLGPNWGLYGFLFELKATASPVTIGVQGAVPQPTALVCAPAITPATEQQKADWARQDELFRQFGFFTSTAQRRTPGIPADAIHALRPLNAITNRVVFVDDRFDIGHVQHLPRIVDFLTTNGVVARRAEDLAAWMRDLVAPDADAYGSACVLPSGYTPMVLFEETDGSPLWQRYLQAGGRLVNITDVPLYTFQSADGLPFTQPQGTFERLGLNFGWNSPYWGQDLAITPTAQGKAWGFESLGATKTGFSADDVSVVFSRYDVPELPDRPGAAAWHKNYRPDMPWSGLIQVIQYPDGNNDAHLRDVWRATHYVGRTVEIPALPPPMADATAPPLSIVVTASGMPGREELARGERASIAVHLADTVDAATVALTLRRDGAVLKRWESAVTPPGQSRDVTFTLDTDPFAFGAYTLQATASGGAGAARAVEQPLGIRFVPPESFSWGIWIGDSQVRARRDMIVAAQAGLGMEPLVVEHTTTLMDAILRQNIGFSLKINDESLAVPPTTNPAAYWRITGDGKPWPDHGYAGGRPMPGITHPEVLAAVRQAITAHYRTIAFHPALRPRICCNDDMSSRYGFDYAPRVRATFKALTGHDAPGPFESGKDVRNQITIPAQGIVPDDEPWIQWSRFALEHIGGAYNRMEVEAVTSVRPDTTIGPVPGGMQIPLISLWDAGQYPPLNFGAKGFNLGYSYYYNTYWQPLMTGMYWIECNRMGNRDLPVWMLIDSWGYGLYLRNNLFHALAGGVQGLPYFEWSHTRPESWQEFQRQAPLVRRIGPVQHLLKPGQRQIGLLMPFTAGCYSPADHLLQPYAFANLVMGHFDVEPVAEEELIDGSAAHYDAILLFYTRWLRQSAADALARYAAAGGRVILDPTVPFDIPGAIRLSVDLGMGQERTTGVPGGQSHLSVPGNDDYGVPARIWAIAAALREYVPPAFECPDVTLTARRFTVGDVPYTWFVNAQSGEEFRMARPLGCGYYGKNEFKKLQPWIDEVERGRFAAPVTFTTLPGVPYDLGTGRRLPVHASATGSTFTVDMDRLGGTLVAFYPEPIETVTLAAPATAAAMQPATLTVQVRGASGPVPGAVPIHIELRDPAGNASPIGGYRATDAGTYTLTWTPAVNDLRGTWSATVEELASGRKAAATIALGAEVATNRAAGGTHD